MIKYIFIPLCILYITTGFSQESPAITTAFPFLLISTDPIASGIGDIGVASSADAFSQKWNSSKYLFAENTSAIAATYTPYLSSIAKDIFLGNITYYKKYRRSALGCSFTYFSVGKVELNQNYGNQTLSLGNYRPTEFAFDLSYNLLLSEHFAMGVTARYIRSALQLPTDDRSVANGIAFDICGYYTSKEHLISDYIGSYTLGFQLSNLGQKVKYDKLGQEFFIPTNLRIGGGYHLHIDQSNALSLLIEANKLLVPSPQKDRSEQHKTFLEGIFSSFTDAQGGITEELQEVSLSFGVSYNFENTFFLRTGYFTESELKGYRKYLTIGTGFSLNSIQLDFSYLFNTSKVPNPLSSSLRIGIQYKR